MLQQEQEDVRAGSSV